MHTYTSFNPAKTLLLVAWLLFPLSPASGQLLPYPYPQLLDIDAAYPLANRVQVQKELEMTEDQLAKLSALQAKFREIHLSLRAAKKEYLATTVGLPTDEQKKATDALVEFTAKENQKIRKDIEDLLSSKQKRRFEQILFQYHVSRGDYVIALSLQGRKISKESRIKLQAAEKLRRSKLEEQILQMEAASRTAMLSSSLGIPKRSVAKMFGAAFDFRAERNVVFSTLPDKPRTNPRRGRKNLPRSDSGLRLP